MRFGELRSIGHNIADSLASGYSELAGVYDLDVFGAAGGEGLEIDFLAGTANRAGKSAFRMTGGGYSANAATRSRFPCVLRAIERLTSRA